jgi:DNA invertase Pin-like site-specific DNA recombinase
LQFTGSTVIFVLLNDSDMIYALYMRVSTEKQGRSGLGIAGQRAAFAGAGISGKEFVEVKSGRKKHRPILDEAIQYCKDTGATLVVAKLDRLARDVVFMFGIRQSGIAIRALDVPELNTLTIGIFATMAQYEHELMCARQKAAMDAKLIRDGQWRVSHLDHSSRIKGAANRRLIADANENNRRAMAFIRMACEGGKKQSYGQLANRLNENDYRTANNCKFTAVQVRRLALKSAL